MKESQRLTGVDVFRGLAMYAVIIVHVDEGVKVLPPGWLSITNFASFCVPFFLATAFYFAINKLYTSQGRYPLKSRLFRLLIPYGVWSLLYLLYKAAKYMVAGEPNRLFQLLQDPLSLVFFGGASYHLYFLPLLAIGTLLIKFVEFLIEKKFSLQGVGLIALVSLLVYQVILSSGNGLKEPDNVAFEPLLAAIFPEGNSNPLLRLLLVELSWALRCLPYVMFAMLLAHPKANKFCSMLSSNYSTFWVLVFLVVNIFGSWLLPDAVEEVGRGYSAVIAAITVSTLLKENTVIKNIGLCSFGIYLIHIFFVEVFQSVVVRLAPGYNSNASTAILLLAAALVFLVSWGTTNFLLKHKRLAQIL
ncbi:acyltransferase [Cyanobacteria bacterium FACHB-63]|nr:acyltransferase [Cyanobacteria bacterium FACHB-63]